MGLNIYLQRSRQIFELVQGRVLFGGKAAPQGGWTAEEDQFAQMIELFGYLPLDLLSQGKHTSKYFTNEGVYIGQSFLIMLGY